jgi:hypothetical protein
MGMFTSVVEEMRGDGLITTRVESEGGGTGDLVFQPTRELIVMATEVGVDPEWLGTQIMRFRLAKELGITPDEIQVVPM